MRPYPEEWEVHRKCPVRSHSVFGHLGLHRGKDKDRSAWAPRRRCIPMLLVERGRHALVGDAPKRHGHDLSTVTLAVPCRSAVVGSAVFVPNCNRDCGQGYDLSVGAVPSAPSPLFLDPNQPSCAAESAVRKCSTRDLGWGNETRCPMSCVASCMVSRNSPNTFFA